MSIFQGVVSKLCATVAALSAILFLNGITFAQQDEGRRELYNNQELFNQLSGAAQNLLRKQFGPRPGEKVGTGQSSTLPSLAPPGGVTPFVALVNTLVNNPAADATASDTQSETAIILGSGSNIIGSFNDSGSNAVVNTTFTGFSTSANGGTSWTDGGVLPANANGDAGDPVLARDKVTGEVYLATLQFSGNGLRVFKSTNDGVSWGTPTQGAPGAGGFQDKEWITVDNFAGAGQGNVYLAWRDFGTGGGIRVTRSTDHGATFSPSPGLLLKTGQQGAYVVVGTDHSVYVFWYDSQSGRSIRMRKSTDQGVTFATEVTVTTLTSTGVNGDLSLPAGFRSSSFPAAAVNSVTGDLYVVYNDPTAASGGDRGNIKFRQSTDGGATWGAAVNLNDDGTTRTQYMPAIAVKPDGGGLAVTWYDNRNDPNNRNIERWGVTATISGSTVAFNPNFRISPQFAPSFGADPIVNSVYMGDYDMMDADNAYFHTLWGDNRDQSIAVPSRKNANVRHAKFTIDGPGAIPTLVSAAVGASGGNGNSMIDRNECNDIFVTLGNDGSQSATGISATLATSTPGVTVTQAVASFPSVAPRTTATNSSSFKVSTSPAFVCGSAIVFTLSIDYAGGSDVLNFTMQSNTNPGAPILFENTTPTAIVDNTTTNIPISVSGLADAIGKVTISFYATHTWDEDLDIYLIAPDGTTVELSTDNGGSGDNYGTSCSVKTVFDDAAASSITSGTPPFAGTFRPQAPLAAFNGKSGGQVNGTWTLRFTDDVAQDAGTFQCATLSIAPAVCIDGGGGCSITAAPVVTSPIFAGATNVSGTSSEADGTTIEVFVNSLSVGTTTVASGVWTKGGLVAAQRNTIVRNSATGLVLGDNVKATAKAFDKQTSPFSNEVTVSAPVTPFTDISAGLTAVYGSAAWGDYDNDGDLDILLTGVSNSGGNVGSSLVYRNDGSGVFTDINAGLPGVTASSVAWGDYDNDGDLDILLTGSTDGFNSGATSKVYRNDGGTFTDIAAGLTGVQYSSVAWGDYDNDGDLDILLTGRDAGGNYLARVYNNTGGIFTDIIAGLTGVQYSSVAWGDYDSDGDLDILLTGLDPAIRISKVYRNTAGTFTDISAGLTGVAQGSVAWGDYDNDGDLDILLTGGLSSGSTSKVYRNDNGTFTDINAALTAVSVSAVAWGDYDNDGDLDILIEGYSGPGSTRIANVYRNDGGTFTDINAGLTPVLGGSVAWGDYDNDGDLDILLTGLTQTPTRVSAVYRNNTTTPNTIPTAPAGLTATPLSGNRVALAWNAASDGVPPAPVKQNPGGGKSISSNTPTVDGATVPVLSYNLRVGTTPGGINTLSPMANTSNGYRRVARLGSQQILRDTLTLPSGQYYWSVQAIDAAFAGGPFATEASFASCAPFTNNRAYVNASAVGANNGTTWADAFTSLQSALAITGTCSITEIWVAAGTYKPTTGSDRAISFVMKNGVAMYGGFPNTGNPTMADRNVSANPTILSGDIGTPNDSTDNSYHVIFNNYTVGTPLTSSAVLDGFTITGGNANAAAPHCNGAGMYNVYASPTITSCFFLRNTVVRSNATSTESAGGGMYNSNSSPSVSGCVFSNNWARAINTSGHSYGAGMYNSSGSPMITNCTFSNNTTPNDDEDTYGGGMFNENVTVTVTGCAFSNNQAVFGGGMRNSSSTVTISNCTFTGNQISTYPGGVNGSAINNNNTSGTIAQCVFTSNGGVGAIGVEVYSGNPVISISRCVFSGNNYGVANQSAAPTITNCVFTGNTFGGLVNWPGGTSSPTITNSTFSENPSSGVAAISNYNTSTVTLKNCVVYGAGNSVYNPSGTFDISYSNIKQTSGVYTGVGNINQDPLYVNAGDPDGGDNTWMTSDDGLALQAGSPSINTADNTGAPTTDIVGNPRPLTVANRADMGAYEAPFTPSVASINAIQSRNIPLEQTFTQFAGASSNATIGWSFTIGASSLSVSHLGLYDSGNNGLANSHDIGIWTSGGSLVTSATIPSGTTGVLESGYRYVSITPVTLNAGQTYVIGALYPTQSGDNIIFNSTQTIASEITYGQSRQTPLNLTGTDPLTLPNLNAGLPQGIFGPNFQFSEVPPIPHTFIVTNTNGNGAGSLQKAIADANATANINASTPDTILFNIPGAGPHTITYSNLPNITDPVIIDGYSQPGASKNTLADGNDAVLKIILHAFRTNTSPRERSEGDDPLGGWIGPAINTSNTTIQGLVVNGMDNPLIVSGSGGNTIIGNFIGTDASGTTGPGNAFGIQVFSANNTIGGTLPAHRNIIALNTFAGVGITTSVTGNRVIGNSIFGNGGLGIDLGTTGVTPNDAGDADTGPNALQNFPEMTLAQRQGNGDLSVTYGVPSAVVNSAYPLRIEFFKAAGGEGKTFLGAQSYLAANAQLAVTQTFTPVAAIGVGDTVVATATDNLGNTSEFSAGIVVTPSDPSGIISDDFNAPVLKPFWTFINPGNPSAMSLVGTGTADARLRIQIPDGASHDVWTAGNMAPRVMQNCNNIDFEVEVKFDGAMSSQYQIEGIIVEQDANRFLRFDFVKGNANTRIFAALFDGGAPSVLRDINVPAGNPAWMRVKRVGNDWIQSYSYDGTNFTILPTLTSVALNVAKIGPFVGNAGYPEGTAPAFNGLIDYFFSTASPIIPEDGVLSGPSITQHPQNATVQSGQTATFTVVAAGTLPLAYQWQRNNVDIGGANAPSYVTLPNTVADNGAAFRCIVSNSIGTVTSNAAILTVTSVSNASGITSDDFNAATLKPFWQFVNPGTPSTLSMVGTGTVDARASLAVPAGAAHDVWTGANNAPRIMQPMNNTDFEVEVKFEQPMNAGYQLEGIIVEQSAGNYLRFGFVHDFSNTRLFAASFTGNVPSVKHDINITGNVGSNPIGGGIINDYLTKYAAAERGMVVRTNAVDGEGIEPTGAKDGGEINPATMVNTIYLRVKRVGNSWTQSYSADGVNFVDAPSFNHTLTAALIGPYIGNAGSTPSNAPAFTGLVDYFFNTASPISPEDGTTSPPVITTHPANQTVGVGQTATFTVGVTGSTPLSFQWQKNNANIGGATNPSYQTPSAQLADNGSQFRCIVSNAVGTATSNNAILTVTTVSNPSGIVSDDFHTNTLNPMWQFVNPAPASTLSLVGSGTPNARLSLAVPSGQPHDIWFGGNNAARIMQPSNNTDFEIEVKFEQTMTSGYQIEGVLVQQTVDDFVRFGLVRDQTNTRVFAASFVGGIPTVRTDVIVTQSNPLYLRVKRTGNEWLQTYSNDGTTFISVGPFTHAMTATAVGVYAGNASLPGVPAPAFTSLVDYFFNTALPIVPEDPAPVGPLAGGGGPAGLNGGNVTEAKFIPTEFSLKQNFPNPFNPATTIEYDIPYESNATLAIYNTLGQEVATLVNERHSAGRYHITWNAANIASGMYFYRLSTFDKANKPLVFMKKLVVVK